MKTTIGTIIDDKYEALEVLGTGGFGTVYRARQIQFDREVALKVLNAPDLDEALLKRFEREAAILQDFRSKYIPAIYGYGIWLGQPYMAIELVRGKSLATILQDEHAFPLERAKPIITDVAKALEYAHGQGVVHRDLSPANIILVAKGEGEEAKIIDFGLATFSQIDLRNRQKLTEAGFTVGSFQYMSPEQCLAEPADQRSDIYSLGCVLYRTITGRVPYDAENEVLLMRKHVHEAAPHVPSQFPSLVQTIVDRSMAKEKTERYQTATEFLADWQQVDLKSTGDQKRVFTPTLGLLATALLLLAVSAAVTFYRLPGSQQPEPSQESSLTAHKAVLEAADLGEGMKTLGEQEQAQRLEKIIPLLEQALQTHARTNELSERDFEVACVQLARAYRRKNRDADAFRVAEQGIKHEIARGLCTPLMTRTYAAAAMGLDSATKDKALEQLYAIAHHQPPFVLPTIGEARMSLAELLTSKGEFEGAEKAMPEFNKLDVYNLSSTRWEQCKAVWQKH
jgi:serine/threonine protein kinase